MPETEEVIPINYKVLSGIGYTLPRFVGIKAETWVNVTGKEPPITDTQFAEGNIVENSLTGVLGLIINADSIYFNAFPEPHLSRLIDVVDGDGWIQTETEVTE